MTELTEQQTARLLKGHTEIALNIQNIRYNFKNVFMPKIKQLELRPTISNYTLKEIRDILNEFLDIHNLKINVGVFKYKNNIIFYCTNVQDALIWEGIRSLN